MSELQEDLDWSYSIPKDEGSTVHIRILKGEFKDVVYQYGKVGFDEQPDGSVYLKFVYNIVESPQPKADLEGDMKFKNHIGDILTTIISQNMGEGLNDEFGTDYSEESDPQ
jgi:hypothetical protein